MSLAPLHLPGQIFAFEQCQEPFSHRDTCMRPVGRDFLMRDTFKRVQLVVKLVVGSMPRRRKDCPICEKRNLVKLSNYLADIHQLSAVERKYYLSGAKYLSDPKKPGDMSSRKRMRSDSEESTVARDEESEEEISSPKRMQNESDDETSTVLNKDIFSSSDDDKSSEETDDASNEGESSEEMDDSDEEADPWRALIDEATAELHTKHSELVQSFENEGFSEIDAKKQAFAAILPELRKELGNVYMDRL